MYPEISLNKILHHWYKQCLIRGRYTPTALSLTKHLMYLFFQHLHFRKFYYLTISIKANCWCVVIPPAIGDYFTISSTIISRSSCVSGNCYPVSDGDEAWYCEFSWVTSCLSICYVPCNTFTVLW